MNDNHRRNIGSTFRHIDDEFAQIEGILTAIGANSPLSQYHMDIQPMQERIIGDYLQRIRREMVAAMDRFQINPDGRRISASWAIRNRLLGVSIAIAEMDPHHMRGYGNLTSEDKTEIVRICSELERLVGKIDAYLGRAGGPDIGERLASLPGLGHEQIMLSTLEQVIARHHLLEFRPALEMILSRLESNEFEIAFFGRVSSGKSSLLNHILGHDVLPVGVTPVTAVPTRVHLGTHPEIIVRSELSPPQHFPLERIPEFVSEEGNPKNTKRVNSVEVLIPSDALADGIAFVDTPGIGSLATSGEAQTIAYLPRCDLGVLLLDAGSTLNEDDLRILQALWEASVSPMVLLSKCDLLTPTDRERIVGYITQQVGEKLGLPIKVLPVSIMTRDPDLAREWFAEHVQPLLANHRSLFLESIQRKLVNLHESVTGALQRMLDGGQSHTTRIGLSDLTAARQLLDSMATRMSIVTETTTQPVDRELPDSIHKLFEQVAARMTTAPRHVRDRIFTEVVIDAMASSAESARSELIELGMFLSRSINELSRLMNHREGDPPDAFAKLLTPLPSPQDSDLARIPQVYPLRWLAWWPALARWAFRRRAREQCYWPIHELMHDHRQKLRKWTRDNLAHIADWCASYVDPYRERLRQTSQDNAVNDIDVSVVKADLDLLRKIETEIPHDQPLTNAYSSRLTSAPAIAG